MRKKSKLRGGFVVICAGSTMRLHDSGRGLPDGGVLVFGSYATLFSTRARARKAVERTANYALANGLSWPVIDRSKVKITSARVEPRRRGDVHSGS